MRPDRSLGVVRARGVEAALAAEPARQRDAVQADASEQRQHGRARPPSTRCGAHGHVRDHLRAREQLGHLRHQILRPGAADRGSWRPRRRRIRPRPAATSRHAARRMRRARLRCTAPPTRRPATKASRPGPGRDKHYHPLSVKGPCRIEQRLRDLASAFSRLPRRTGGRGPCGGAREMIARPARVRMRRRKPCRLARRRLFG